jgi:hypothetical protein
MTLQPLIKITLRETKVMQRPATVGTIEVQQVHGAVSVHRANNE